MRRKAPAGSVHCELPQEEAESGGNWALSSPGRGRSHFILRSWAMDARRCLSTTSSSKAQGWASKSCRNSQKPSRGSFRRCSGQCV